MPSSDAVRVRAEGGRVALEVCTDMDIDPNCEVEFVTAYMTPCEAIALAIRLIEAAVAALEGRHSGAGEQ